MTDQNHLTFAKTWERALRQLGIAMLTVVVALGLRAQALAESPESAKRATIGSIERLDPALDQLVSSDAKLEVLCEGFEWSEGPVWVASENFLLFSDIPNNAIMRWDENSGCKLFLKPAGYTGDVHRGGETGSNGLALDSEGRLLLCQHGDRRIARLNSSWSNPEPSYTTLADRFDGKRFNSPNDLVVHSSGAIFFTDPPYGLEKIMEDPAKELDFQGVFCLSTDGSVSLVTRELDAPNGIALSPDEKTLYVANSDGELPIIMAFPLNEDLSVGKGRVLFDARSLPPGRPGACDGMAVDAQGNLFATAPGGVVVVTPEGKLLGSLLTTKRTANCKFGEDGHTLFITADDSLLRVRTKAKGLGFK